MGTGLVLRVRAVDARSAVTRMQVRVGATTSKVLPYKAVRTLARRGTVHVRVADAAGNWSRWTLARPA